MPGMPPHIAQLVAGHCDINTTMGYKADYPEEVINGHRAFIAHHRALRTPLLHPGNNAIARPSQLAESGSDYISSRTTTAASRAPGLPMLDQAGLNAGVAEAHCEGQLTIAHALGIEATWMAVEADIDGLTTRS